MRATRALILGGLVLLVAGCGRSAPTPTAQLATYVQRVDVVEKKFTGPLESVTRVTADFNRAISSTAQRKSDPLSEFVDPQSAESRLKSAWRRLRSLTAKLAAVPAPHRATRLKTLILEVAKRQTSLTLETEQLLVFLPQYTKDLRPYGSALASLEQTLVLGQAYGSTAVAALYARKEAALHHFQAQAKQMISRLRKLSPPPVAKAEYEAELASLRGEASNAGRLATLLASGNTAATAPVVKSFEAAASGPQSPSAQHAQRVAIKAYDRQLVALNRLAALASAQRVKLIGGR